MIFSMYTLCLRLRLRLRSASVSVSASASAVFWAYRKPEPSSEANSGHYKWVNSTTVNIIVLSIQQNENNIQSAKYCPTKYI